MKFAKIIQTLALSAVMVACNGPDRSTPISSLPINSIYPLTGAFKNHPSLPVHLKTGDLLYVQNGKIFEASDIPDPRSPYCEYKVQSFKIDFKPMLDAYGVKQVALSVAADSFLKQHEVVKINLKRGNRELDLQILASVQPSELGLANEIPIAELGFSLDGTLECTNHTKQIFNTLEFTAGELMDVFQFKYIWQAPGV